MQWPAIYPANPRLPSTEGELDSRVRGQLPSSGRPPNSERVGSHLGSQRFAICLPGFQAQRTIWHALSFGWSDQYL